MKSNSHIYTIYYVIRALKRSDTEQFNYITNVFAFNSITKWTLYKYCHTFLSLFNSPQHSLLSISYFFLLSDYRLLKNLNECLFSSVFNWFRWASHSLRFISETKIILSVSSLYCKDIRADTVVNAFFSIFIVSL